MEKGQILVRSKIIFKLRWFNNASFYWYLRLSWMVQKAIAGVVKDARDGEKD